MLGLTQNQLLGKTSLWSLLNVIHEDGTYFKLEELAPTATNLKPVNKIVM
jgi:hypothetical protein